MTSINPLAVDLSHWDPAYDYNAVANDGIDGVIYKATEGQSYTDDTYVAQQHAAKVAGLAWGAYHFADGSNVDGQVANFLRFAAPDDDELFCLDWEDNGGDTMSLSQAEQWIEKVETALGRPGECVLYSGNTAKEALGDTVNEFLGARRLWLCQYGSSPTWQRSWDKPWLWQFTDGVYGPTPHSIEGIGECDINSYDGTSAQMIDEWASGTVRPEPPPPRPTREIVDVLITAPSSVLVKVRQRTLGAGRDRRRPSRSREAQ